MYFCLLFLLLLENIASAEEFHPAVVGPMDYLKMILGLAAILGLMVVLYRGLKRVTGPKGGARYFKFIDRALIGPQTVMVLCQLGGKYYVLATSPKEITLIDKLDEMPATIVPEESDLSFRKILSQFQKNHES